jgi:putative protein-disulfide isomerase
MQRIVEAIYMADPLDPWCRAFAPELSRLRQRLGGETRFSLCMSHAAGERTGAVFREWLAETCGDVARHTGRCRDTLLPKADAFDTGSEPVRRAVCTGRALDPDQAFDLFEMLQEAFFDRGEAVTHSGVMLCIAEAAGYETARFRERFDTEAMCEQVFTDMSQARSFGVTRLPALALIDAQGHLSILKGYRTFEQLEKLLGL